MILARHDRPDDVALIVGPMFHTAALNSHYTSRLALGATSVVVGKFDPGEFMETVHREKITVVSGTPSMFIMLMEHCSPGQYDTSLVTTLSTGSDKTPDHVKRAMVALFPNAQGIYDIYGCTECAPCVTTLDKSEYFTKKDSVGPPLPFVEVRLLGEKGEEVPVGQPGEIVVRGPTVMKGYFNQPEETAKVMKDGWLYTGDLARSDEDGYLYIVGRKKEIIISGGENVSAREVEDVLVSHPAIFKAAVFGLPDKRWVEKVTAAVVLREGHALTDEQLLSFLRERMAGYKIPKEIIFTDQLPESATGKVQKEVLKKKYADSHVS
jgi:acyl-CoA synthetase (AMP-forming)/AMP-acid ligase II